MSLSNDSLKIVTVRPTRPFRIGNGGFTSVVNKMPLTIEHINLCLQEKAFVTEHLSNGKTVPLDFNNYNQDNGPTDVTVETKEFVPTAEIEMIGQDGNRYTINKKAEPVKNIIYKDLESEKKKQIEEAIRKQEEANKVAEAAEKAAREKQLEEARKKKDEEERQKAIDAIMAREKAKAAAQNKTAPDLPAPSNSSPKELKASFDANARLTVKGPHVAFDANTKLVDTTATKEEPIVAKMAPSVDELKKRADAIDWSKVPDYNKIDWDKDDLSVIKSKLDKVESAAKNDFTKSDQQETKKTKFDNNNNGKRK